MMYPLYNALLAVIAPVAAMRLRSHPKYREISSRLAPQVPALPDRPIWVHACSVGEVNTAKPILNALRKRFPDVPLLLTASTVTGHALAERISDIAVAWFPFDTRKAVNCFLNQAQPRALVIVETELWPNVLRETERRGVPVIVVNGRISDKHYPRYLRAKPFFAAALRHVTAIGVQNDAYAKRFSEIGAAPERIQITGNTKFDGVTTAIEPKLRHRLKIENGLPQDAPIVIFGSTRPGDEALAAQCWQSLSEEFPALRMIIAVRHADRLPEILPLFNEPVLRRSEVKAGRAPAGERVLIIDTVGELVSFYGIATIAVVGGSFYPGVNGHNPLEPAALGIPTVFGPNMSNFMDPARVLVSARGAIQVHEPGELTATIRTLLNDPAEQRQLGTRARKAVLDNQGAIERNVDLVQELLTRSS